MSPAHPRHPGDHGPGEHHPDSRRRPQEEPPSCLVLSRDAVRRVDRVAVDRYGIPSIVLMENAAIGLRERSLAMMLGLGTERVVILAGPGNNGGDGLALARHLHNAGAEPLVLLAADPERLAARGGDAATNLAIVQKMRIELERLDRSAGAELLERSASGPVLIVDALLGTGLRDAATGIVRDAILHVNRVRAPRMGVLAVDVPSGLDCDTGEPAGGGPAVIADATVTFVALKPGMLRLEAQRWTGDVTVAEIGVPRELVEELGEHMPDTRPGPRTHDSSRGGESAPPASHGRGADRGG